MMVKLTFRLGRHVEPHTEFSLERLKERANLSGRIISKFMLM
jgi:hypothetical protein